MNEVVKKTKMATLKNPNTVVQGKSKRFTHNRRFINVIFKIQLGLGFLVEWFGL